MGARLGPLVLGFGLLLGLPACSTLRSPPTAEDRESALTSWDSHRLAIEAVTGFELQGRLAVKGGGLSGALRWRQDGSRFNLRLSGPFGAGALVLDGDESLVAIKGQDIDLITAEPERVLAARTGWQLPLPALRWWVLGIPVPQQAAGLQLDARGRVTGFSQLGWALAFSDYREGTPSTPGRIEARREGTQALVIVESLSLVAVP